MRESLRIKWPAKVAIPLEQPRFGKGIEVIPADLGRELYEALVDAEGRLDAAVGEQTAVPQIAAAIARYEREVSSD